MITKIIHYCWFGRGEKSELINTCIESWKKFLPDYQIIEWNEDNFDVNACQYTREAYENKKWAFVSDYVRVYALYNYGGIYLDTDVEVLKSFDCFLDNHFFTGYESKEFTTTAIIGSEKKVPIIESVLGYYENKSFYKIDKTLDMKPNPYIFREYLQKQGVILNGKKYCGRNITIYPQVVFSPNTFSMVFKKKPRNSYAIHHFDQSWRNTTKRNFDNLFLRVRHYLVGIALNIIGIKLLLKIKKFF